MFSPNRTPEVLVIGGGVAGSAAVLRAAQYNLPVTWIRGSRSDANRSRSQWVVNVDNMIGVHEGIIRKKVDRLLGRDEALHSAKRALEQHEPFDISTRDIIANAVDRIESNYGELVTILEQTAVSASKLADGSFEVKSRDAAGRESVHHAPKVVLATGVMDRQPSILKDHRGNTVDDMKWIYPAANREQVLYCIRCEGHLTHKTKAAVVGHRESSAQVAMMLHERYGSSLALLTNGEEPEWSDESTELLRAYGIEVIHGRITELQTDRAGLHKVALDSGRAFEVSFVLVSLGLYRVYNELAVQLGAVLEDSAVPVGEKHVLIDSTGATSVDGLFAIGDMTSRTDEPVMKQIYTSQEYAVRAIDTIDRARRATMKKRALLALTLNN